MTKRPRKRLVVKVGTNTLTNGADSLCRPVMLDVVRQVAQLLLMCDAHDIGISIDTGEESGGSPCIHRQITKNFYLRFCGMRKTACNPIRKVK